MAKACELCGSISCCSPLREPSGNGPPLSSGSNQIDWEMARKAATAILKQCDDAGFDPPEAMDKHKYRLLRVCEAMNSIVDALRLKKG